MSIRKVLDNKIAEQLWQDNWPIRRRWMRFAVIALSVNAEVVLINVLFFAGSGFAVQIFMTLLGAIMSILMFYVFGAVWDDNNKRQYWSSMTEKMNDPNSAPPSEEDGEGEKGDE
jgi:hypothetical protein